MNEKELVSERRVNLSAWLRAVHRIRPEEELVRSFFLANQYVSSDAISGIISHASLQTENVCRVLRRYDTSITSSFRFGKPEQKRKDGQGFIEYTVTCLSTEGGPKTGSKTTRSTLLPALLWLTRCHGWGHCHQDVNGLSTNDSRHL